MPRLLWAMLALALSFAAPAWAQAPPKGLQLNELAGKVGGRAVGMSLTVRDMQVIEAAHYFYAGPLKDIPLQARIEAEDVILTEPGGGVFRLHLVTADASAKPPLNFYNSTGLEGTWTGGGRTLPVKLGFETGYPHGRDRPWYWMVTKEPDAAYEARVQRFVRGALAGNREAVARSVSYPLTVRQGPHKVVLRTPAELKARWSEVFTPKLLSRLRDALPHEMFTHNGMAMILNGEVWFDAKGAAVINLP